MASSVRIISAAPARCVSIRRLFGVILVVLGLSASAALGQTPAASPAPETIQSQQAIDSLLTILRDDAARQDLIARLEKIAPGAAETPLPPVAKSDNLAQQFAAATAAAVTDSLATLRIVAAQLTNLGAVFKPFTGSGPEAVAFRADAAALGLTILVTLLVRWLLGMVVQGLAHRLRPDRAETLLVALRRAGLVFIARLLVLTVAWLAGQTLSGLAFTPAPGSQGDSLREAQSLFLNAFVVFGAFRALLRLLVSPDAQREPSISRASPDLQRAIFVRVAAVAGIVIQGFLFLIPLAQLWSGFVAARSMRTCLASLAAVVALLAIRRISGMTAAQRPAPPDPAQDATEEAALRVAEGAHGVLRRIWPPLAAVYVLFVWLVAVSRPNLLQDLVLGSTIYTLVAVALLAAGLRLMRIATRLSVPLPETIRRSAPQLGPRVDAIARLIAWGVALILVPVAAALVIGGWGWIDLGALTTSAPAQGAFWRAASAVMVILGAAALWAVFASWIDGQLSLQLPGRDVSARTRTLLALFRNTLTIAIAIFATMIALSQIGIDIAPLLAGAGVIGLAIGFGAQKMVQDIITGVFIQLENAINEGDVVGVAGITGAVEKVTIRSVRLRTIEGAVHIVPFSSVDTVTNLTRDYGFHVAEIGVAYKEKVEDVKDAMQAAYDRLCQSDFAPDVLEPLEMHGVISLADSSVVIRARIKTRPGKQWALGRRYTELVKELLDERGIEIPFPHRQIVLPEGLGLVRRGEAQSPERPSA
ncbi:mechanosensitive ion channel [bacterium]|nr:mechanosensitive ion channel [bacterium]